MQHKIIGSTMPVLEMTLEVGDSAYIDSGMAHMFLNVGRGEALMTSICYSDAIDRPALTAAGVAQNSQPVVDPDGQTARKLP